MRDDSPIVYKGWLLPAEQLLAGTSLFHPEPAPDAALGWKPASQLGTPAPVAADQRRVRPRARTPETAVVVS